MAHVSEYNLEVGKTYKVGWGDCCTSGYFIGKYIGPSQPFGQKFDTGVVDDGGEYEEWDLSNT